MRHALVIRTPGLKKKSQGKHISVLLGIIVLGFLSTLSYAQSRIPVRDQPEIPPNFKLDIETGAHLRLQFLAQSMAATGRYAIGKAVFERLIAQLPHSSGAKFAWELRIINGDQLNAYSSPEGTIYVETGLAQLVNQSTGLWAAMLAHEIAHVVRRDWARRYLYQNSLQEDSLPAIVLGDPGFPSASWSDSSKASEKLGRFCRQLEVDADRDSLLLMARAGYHPHFVPALHHLLHATASGTAPTSLYAMHPCWEERDHELSHAYVTASIEFAHRWPEWYASPGGNPPIVVFATTPTVRKTGAKQWEVQVPLRCENLAGAVEVVLRTTPVATGVRHSRHFLDQAGPELREVTGCTSPLTTVTFTFSVPSDGSKPSTHGANVFVFDGWGAVLARVEVPKLPR